jgi:8-oxo-dGTP pyrophosphatase MutT (NUDIX family)
VAVLQGIHRRSLRLLRWVPTPLLERAVRLRSPSYTLGAACMIEHDGAVLLVQTAYRRTWSLPGGLLDRGEPPLDGLRREVREEVGLEVDVRGEPIVIVDLGSQLVDFFYRASLPEGVRPEDAHAGSTEIEEVAWVDRDEARTRVRGGSRLQRKFALFDDLPEGGGMVVLERGRRLRRGDGGDAAPGG